MASIVRYVFAFYYAFCLIKLIKCLIKYSVIITIDRLYPLKHLFVRLFE